MKLLLTLLPVPALVGFAVSFSAPSDRPDTTAEAAGYTIDATHSSVLFKTNHGGVANFYGRFNGFQGEVTHDPAAPGKSSIRIVIDASSIDTNSRDRDRHLRSNDFLSAQEFPEIVFESKKVEAEGDRLHVQGDLTFHGVTKEVSAGVEVVGTGTMRGAKVAGFEARFTIDMGDFGVSYVAQNPGTLGPEVELIVSLECRAE